MSSFSRSVLQLFSLCAVCALAAVPGYGQNHAPVVTGGSYTTDEDVPVAGTVAATDADGDRIVFRIASQPLHGAVTGISEDGAFSYNPDANYNGSDSFKVVASDGTAESAEATVSITISPVNDAPIGKDDFLETDEDKSLTGTLSASDVDTGDSQTFRISTKPAHGRVDLSPSGGFSYTPEPNFYGWDSFGFIARDATLDSAEATVWVTVNPVNDVPFAQSLKAAVAPGQILVGQLPGFDADTDTITYAKTAGPSTITVDRTGRFAYTPSDAQFKGTVTFEYTVNDGKLTSAPGTVTIYVGNDTVGFVGDTLVPNLTATQIKDSETSFNKSEINYGNAADLAVDRLNRRLYVLTSRALDVYDIDSGNSPPRLARFTSVDTVFGTHLALSFDGRTAYIGSTGEVTAINLYPESVFECGQSVMKEPFKYLRTFALPRTDRPIAAMGVHPAGDRLFVVIDMDPAQKKININNDLLRSDVGNGVTADKIVTLPGDFGFITQLDISADVQTDGKPHNSARFSVPLNIKDLLYPNDHRVAIGIKSLAFSPDGNCAFLTAVGAQSVRATAFGIMPTSDEGTGGIVVLDVRPLADPDQAFARYLSFVPTTEKGENTAELRHQIQREGWKIVHPVVQYARGQYLAAEGEMALAATNPFTAQPGLNTFTLASIVLDEMERSYRDYGYMQAYNLMYPHDMVGASGVAINHRGDFGVVTMQDTNNLGLLSLAPSLSPAGYAPGLAGNAATFFIAIGTGKTVNGFDAGLPIAGATSASSYNWAYPQRVAFTSDDSRIYVGMAGGTPKTEMTNKFGSGNALNLLAYRDAPDSPSKHNNLAPGYELFGEPGLHRSPRVVATLNVFDADHDMLSDQLEAYNRWNSLKPISAEWKTKLVSTDAAHITDPGKPNSGVGALPDALDFGYMLPPSGVGYRLNTFGMPATSVNFALKGVVATLERIGCEWDQRFRGHDPAISADVTITRPYFIVGLLSQPGGGVLKDASGEALKYTVTTGSQVDFPYFTLSSDAAHDFVRSNEPSSPLDNSLETDAGFDRPNTEALIRLLLAQPLVKTIELDPYVLKLIPDLQTDPRVMAHGRLYAPGRAEGPEDRRDLDNHMLVTFYSIEVDLDIDSDNSGKIDGNFTEDVREAVIGAGGKFVAVNGGDQDGDGIPNYADGYDLFSGQGTSNGSPKFTPMVIRFPDGLDLATTQFRLIYSESDPKDVTRSGTSPYQFSLPHTGAYRIWIKDGDVARKMAPIDAGGDFIKSNTNYTVQLLLDKGVSAGTNRSVTVYLEAVEPGISLSERQVEVEVIPNVGSQSSLGTLTDTVSVCSAMAMLAVDADRDGSIKFPSENNSDATSKEQPYRFWLNDDIDRQHTVDGSDSEEDDIGGEEEIGMRSDCLEDRIQCKRDLEDYNRLWIYTSGLSASFKDEASPLCLGLQWTDTGGTHPAIKLVKQIEADGGTKYLTDETTAQSQISGNAAAAVVGANTYATSVDASDANRRFFVLPKSLFAGLNQSTSRTYLLFEGVQVGKGQLRLVILKKENGSYTKIADGPGVWIDLKKIEDYYERWTVGDTNGGNPLATAARRTAIFAANGNLFSYSSGFAYDAQSPEENKYILYVHGWNMQPWEKNRFAETMVKRLYWQGYKGRFGVFCWPTTYSFEPPRSAILDSTNYDRGEWAAWKSATALKNLLSSLNGAYSGKVYVMAHSMGNVVTGEALRLASQQGTGQIVDTYIASQAAVPAHCYDGQRAEDLAVVFDFATSIGRAFDGSTFPQTPNVYPDWLTGNGSAAARRVNFYNENDYALWHDVWELNQFFKPDRPDAPDQPWYYTYEDGLGVPPNIYSSFIRFERYDDMANPVGIHDLHLGTAANVQDRYEIMAFASESRTRAVGAVAGQLTMNRALNLQSIWPADNQSIKLHSGLNYSAHKWHSAQFRSTNMRQKGYWQALLGDQGFDITIP